MDSFNFEKLEAPSPLIIIGVLKARAAIIEIDNLPSAVTNSALNCRDYHGSED